MKDRRKQTSLKVLYLSFKHGLQKLIEVTDFAVVTWLTFGSSLQLLSQAWLPPKLSYWLPLIYLTYKIAKAVYDCNGVFTRSFTNIRPGWWTTSLPEPDESVLTATNSGVVMFVLCARINHPLGKLAPGVVEIDAMFKNMWQEAKKNHEKWSYLGKTPTLFDMSDGEGTTTFWLSYWKDLKGLQAFAASNVHRIGQNAYNQKKFPWVGIMHETYHAPKGHWECVYSDMPPIGMGALKPVVSQGSDEFVIMDTLKSKPKNSTMYSRMGRLPGEEQTF